MISVTLEQHNNQILRFMTNLFRLMFECIDVTGLDSGMKYFHKLATQLKTRLKLTFSAFTFSHTYII